MDTLNIDTAESEGPLVRCLGEAGYGPKDGIVGRLEVLAQAGLPVPGGLVISHRAHRLFLEESGLLEVLRSGAPGKCRPRAAASDNPRTGVHDQHALDQRASYLRRTYQAVPISEELNRELCEALIGLGARWVVVVGKGFERGGLGSIPEVRDALREAWLCNKGLMRQLAAAARGEEVPTWPVLIQREVLPQYVAWFANGAAPERELVAQERGNNGTQERSVALYDVESAEAAAQAKGVGRMTLDAEAILGEPLQIRWALEDGKWYLLRAQGEGP